MTHPDPKPEGFRLSPQQKRLWQLQAGEQAGVYRAECAVEILGPLDRARLERALDRVVRRHEILRTGCRVLPGMSLPVQFVTDAGAVWSSVTGKSDLAAGRVLEVSLRSLEPERHVLGISLPALCADSRTLELFVRDLGRHYEGTAANGDTHGDEVAYADLAAWQNELLEGEETTAERAFWSGVELPPLDEARLPGENGAHGTFHPRRLTRALDPALCAAIDSVADARGVTPGSLLLACFTLLLARLTSHSRVCVAAGCDGRTYEELAEVLGPFSRYLPLVVPVDLAAPFSSLLERVHQQAVEAPQWQEYFSWDQLRGTNGAGSELPLAPFGFDYVETSQPQAANGVRLVIREARVVAERFKLRLACRRDEGALAVSFEWDDALLAESSVARMADQFTTLVGAAVAEPETVAGRLELLGPAERRATLVAFNATEADYPRDRGFHALVWEQARRAPHRTALSYAGGEIRYGEMQERAMALASQLVACGVRPGEVVGLCLERSPELVIGLLGILEAGAAYLPIDPALPAERQRFMVEDARARFIVARPETADRFSAIEGLRVVDPTEPVAEERAAAIERPCYPESLAYVIYTSGSTGRPKGVMIPHRGLVNYVTWCIDAYGLGRGGRVPVHSPLGFDLTVTSLLAPLAAGDTAVLLPEQPGVEALAAALREGTAALIKLTPSHLDALAESLRADTSNPAVGALVIGGEALHREQLDFWRERAYGVRLFNEYGPTETVVGSVVYEETVATATATGPVPIGRPIANTRVYLLDDDLEPVPWGVAGELYIAGEGVARGYLGRPELTAERFVPDPFSPVAGARMYRSGDLCRLTEAGLEFRGRADHQVKLRGYRIEPDEIASVLGEMEGVRQAAVIAREDRPGHPRLVAYLVLDGEAGGRIATIREALAARLPDYMVPSAFVVLETLPLTSNGKLDRAALPAPDAAHPVLARSYVPPSTEAEQMLASIWAEVLGVERVGVHDNFFELGGDSILGIQVVSRASRAGLRLSPQQLFQHQTVSELSRVVGRRGTVDAEQGEVTGEVPQGAIVRWWTARDLEERWHYNQSVLLELRERFEGEALGRAVAALVGHHDALRGRFPKAAIGDRNTESPAVTHTEEGSIPVPNGGLGKTSPLFIAPAEGAETGVFEVVELRTAELERHATAVQASLDLERGPIVRAVLYETEAGQRLLLAIHHLAIDGVSWRILLEDLFTGYAQASQGRGRVELGAKTTSYKRWCERLTERAGGTGWDEELAYWRGIVSQPSAALPLDRRGGANTVGAASTVEVRLDAERTTSLVQSVPRAYRTRIDEVLLCALARSVGAWTGSNALAAELEGHGREELYEDVDLSRTVGWFTTLYPVRLAVEPGSSAGAALKSLKEQLRAVPGRGLGYGLLRWVRGESGLESTAEVSFNYLGRFEGTLPAGGPVGLARESAGPVQSARGARSHVLEVTAGIDASGLRVAFTYGTELHERATIEGLAASFARELEGLIEHCLDADAGGVTPSDFPLASLDQASLERVIGGDRVFERSLEDLYPVTPLQAGLLFHTLLSPESGVYFEQIGCTFEGELDAGAFRAAWQQAVSRHAILRTSFVWESVAEPLQVVRREVELPWRELDWRGQEAAEQEAGLERLLEEDRRAGFELTRAPLMRVLLVRLGEHSWRLVWSHHHLILDGWSVAALLGEVLATYHASRAGIEPPLGISPPFSRHVAWLRTRDRAAAEEFWRERLAGFDAPTSIGIERTAPLAGDGEEHGERRLDLPERLTVALERVAREKQLTLATVIHGAWALLLHRYSGSDEVVYGATFSGRSAALAGMESMLGLFINTLPVRARVDPREPTAEFLRGLQQTLAGVQPFEWTPLVDVQGWSDVPRGTPLFESLLVFENYPLDRSLAHPKADLHVTDVRLAERTNYPLTAIAVPGQRLGFRVLFDRRRFEDAAIERLLEHWQRLLEEIATDTERPTGRLALLSPAERHRILVEWNASPPLLAGDSAKARCLQEWVAQHAGKTPEATAVVSGATRLSYAELDSRANQLARYLRARGVGRGVPVCVATERSPEMIVALVGILKAGGAYVPLDPSYPPARLEWMLEETRAPVLLTQESLLERLPAPPTGEIFCLDRDWPSVAGLDATEPWPLTGLDDLLYIIYTSGSTGRPKGVAMPHRALASLLAWQREQSHDPAATTLQFSSPSFDVSCQEIFGTLGSGGTLVLITEAERQDPALLLELIEKERVARLFLPFVALQHLAESAAARGGAPDCLREVVTAGERLQTTPRIAEMFADPTRRTLHNQYGPTETHVVTAHVLDRPASEWPALPPIGRPVSASRVYLLDADLEPVPAGVPGELYAGGDCLARGYYGRPDLTAERFVPDPFGPPGSRLYRTGDRCRWREDGTLDFLGRIDHQVKVRGFRVELGEVEAVLARLPGVREAVVAVREDLPGNRRLIAYVVATEAAVALDEAELLRAAREELPEFMVPSAVVLLDALPLSPNGKVDRRQLPEPGRSRRALDRDFVAPRTALERRLAGIWADVLGVDRVGVHDSFFELGGHSLLATQLVSRLRESFHLELPLREVFEASTVARLAGVIERARETPPAPPIVPIPRDGELRLSFAQERQWVLNQLVPDSAFYNLHAAVRLIGPLEVPRLAETFAEIVRRHEVLRTTFPTFAGRPTIAIAPALDIPVTLRDLSEFADDEREPEARRLAAAEVQQSFDLVQGPLLRVILFRLRRDEHLLLLVMHHIASDGWSLGVLVREVAAIYPALVMGEPAVLPELPIQYADFAAWQRQLLTGDTLARQADYWKEQLADVPPLELPTDRARPAIQTFRGRRHAFALDTELSSRVAALGRERGITPFMTLLAALQLLLGRYAGQEDVAVGTAVAGRNRGEIEGLIGLFINTLVLRTDLGGDPAFVELLDRVRETCLGAWAHQDLPFEKLVDELQPERDLSRAALFQVMFTLQNLPVAPPPVPGGVRLEPVAFDTEAVKFDLTLTMWQEGERFHGTWGYNTDLFEAATVERLDRHFQRLLAAALDEPDRRISELPLLEADERRRQLVEWNDTATPLAERQTVVDLFRERARQDEGATALVFGDATLTYGELSRRANRLAHYLRARGVGPDSRVAVSVERSLDAVVGLLGVMAAGGAYVPLDPTNPRDRIAFMLRDADARVLLTQSALVGSLPEHGAETIRLDADRALIEACSDAELDAADLGDLSRQLAYVIYTSGSTGRPKGVMLEHRGLVNLVLAQQRAFDVHPGDRVLQFASLGFDASVSEIFVTLAAGATLVLAPGEEMLPGRSLVELLERSRISAVTLPPSVLGALPPGRYAELRTIVSAGEPCSRELVARWAPGRRFINAYGPTENTVCATLVEVGSTERTPSIGRPIDNVRVYVLDRQLEPVPAGVAGELYLGGAGVARGYLHNPALTAARFVPDPFGSDPGARLYRTGDACRWLADGTLEFLRRLDEQVKVRGFRIELGEIETVLLEHPAVRAAAVAARADSAGHRRLVAWIVPENSHAPSPAELRAHLEAYLPAYMVPHAFVELSSLPLQPSGKLDRRALRDPEAKALRPERAYVAPRTPLERHLADTWSQALGIERVGIHDNFFELGGDSIKGAILINQLQEKLGQYVYTVALFDAPDIANLSRFLVTNHAEAVRELFGEASLVGQSAEVPAPRVEDADVERLVSLVRALPPRAQQASGRKNPSAVFVLAPPRSGSTLARVMLGGHPRLFAPPELLLLNFDTLAARQEALANGRDDFWLEGVVRAVMELRGSGADEAEAIVEEARREGLDTQAFYARLQSWLGRRTLVDKTPHYALDPEALARAEAWFEGARFIHLTRHPAATVASFEEARLHVLLKPFFREEPPWPPRRLAELIWLACHRHILDFLDRVPEARKCRVRFEDLVATPRPVMERLGGFLGLEFDPGMLEPHKERKARMTDPVRPMARMLGDIKFHEHDTIDATAADRWQRGPARDELSEATWDLAAALGYERPRAARAGSIARQDRDTVADELLGRLDELPPEEIERLLAEMRDEEDPAAAG